MRIDYSIPTYSKNACYLDTNFRFAFRHICLGTTSKLNLNLFERIQHVALGILELCPGVGHLLAWGDKSLNGRIRILKLDAADPWKMGYEQGKTYRSEIQCLYSLVKDKVKIHEKKFKKDTLTEARKLEKFIPQKMIEEMRGLAAGADVPYEDVLCVHTFLDIYPGIFGCTAAGIIQENGAVSKQAVAANHSVLDKSPDSDSLRRHQALEMHSYTDDSSSCQEALRKAENESTVQSIIFDIGNRSIQISSAWSEAASKELTNVKAKHIWQAKMPQLPQLKRKVTLLRNLDWNWPVLGSETILVVRNAKPGQQETVIVTWPGYIGALSGMNSSGVALAACSQGSIAVPGLPTSLLLRNALEKGSSAKEVFSAIKNGKSASSMNVVIAGGDDVARIELHQSTQSKTNFKKDADRFFDSEFLKEYGKSVNNIFRVLGLRKEWQKAEQTPKIGKIFEI